MDELYRERFARTFGIMTEAELERIKSTPVGVAGLGMGGSTFINLVRMGFERFHVADPDVYERTNINRQRAARESTVHKRKDDSLLAEARDINPAIEVEVFSDGVQPDNVERFLDGLEWVVDVVDVFAMDCKLLMNERAHELGIPVASAASLGYGCVVLVFDSTTPSFGRLSGISAELDAGQNLERFIRMMFPLLPEYMRAQTELAMAGKGHIPFVVAGVEFAAAIVVVEITKHLLGIGNRPKAPIGILCEPLDLRLEEFVSPAAAEASEREWTSQRS
jgi:molybdopterin/thiamine biosynthesis adenylyltransferase